MAKHKRRQSASAAPDSSVGRGLTLGVGGDGGVVANGSVHGEVAAGSYPGSTGSDEHTGGPRPPRDEAHQRVLDGDAVAERGSVRPLVGGASNLGDRLGMRSKPTGIKFR